MSELGSSRKWIVRDEKGDASAVIEDFVDGKSGKRTRLTKSLLRDAQGNLTGTHETVEDMGYSPAVLEAQRQRMLKRHAAEKLTRRNRANDVMEISKGADGSYRTPARSR